MSKIVLRQIGNPETMNQKTVLRVRLVDEKLSPVHRPDLRWQMVSAEPDETERAITSVEYTNNTYVLDVTGFERGLYTLRALEPSAEDQRAAVVTTDIVLSEDGVEHGGNGTNGHGAVPVSLSRSARPATEDQALWIVIRNSTNSLQFNRFERFLNALVTNPTPTSPTSKCDDGNEQEAYYGFNKELGDQAKRFFKRRPFHGTDAYKVLRTAADVYMMFHTGVKVDGFNDERQLGILEGLDEGNETSRLGRVIGEGEAATLWKKYLERYPVIASVGEDKGVLPYLSIIRQRLGEVPVVTDGTPKLENTFAYQILMEKLTNPCLIELIWSYWHEEAMLVQAINAVSQRFQNRRTPGLRDPLGQLEIDPLRPLNSMFWGYIQDEPSRLSVLRRAHEYEHQYGFTLHGKALGELRVNDKRSKFLESFHNLLAKAADFFLRDDDTTVVADGFPILNAVKETHYLLAQGAHNQFGELPWQARREMLVEQWLLSRPEMREFLGSRTMVPYPETWMDRVDAMKSLQGWTDTSVVHFRDLGVFGEQVLLSVRYGGWSRVDEPEQAANWARYWRPEIQGYIHAYRAVTGIDLSASVNDKSELTARYVPPSVHLRNRLLQARR
jgi:hypothetical protein